MRGQVLPALEPALPGSVLQDRGSGAGCGVVRHVEVLSVSERSAGDSSVRPRKRLRGELIKF